MAKYSTKKGSVVSADGGKFQLVVKWYSTKSSIVFKPYIKVTDAFKGKHKANIRWQNTKEKWLNHKKTVKSKDDAVYLKSSSKTYSNGDYQIKIEAIVAGKTSRVTLTNSKMTPSKPTVKVSRTNDYRFKIEITQSKNKKDIPTRTLTLQRVAGALSETWETIKEWHMTETGKFTKTYTDQSTQDGNRYRYQVSASNNNGNSGWTMSDWEYTLPPPVSDVQHVRNSNTSNTISWTKSGQEIDRGLITKYNVYRSTNGGEFKLIATVLPGRAENDTITYQDTKCKIDNYYRYYVKPENACGESKTVYPSVDGTEATYNSPGAPSSVIATFNSNGTVKLKIANNSNTATKMEIWKYMESAWSLIEEVDLSDTYTDTSSTTGTHVKYRIRNLRDDDSLQPSEQYSSYTESNELVLLSKPDPPTLLEPVQDAVVMYENGYVRLKWIHNPTDGTAQTARTRRLYKNGTLIDTRTLTTPQQSVSVTIADWWEPGDTAGWSIRTKGEHDDYSDYSEIRTFKVYSRPELHITSPTTGATIDNLPLSLSYDYSDVSGTMASCKLEIVHDDEVVYARNLNVGSGTSGSYTYSLADYLFENEQSYTLRLTALSSTGLQTVDEIGIYIEYVPVILTNQYLIDTDTDEDTGYVTLSISEAETIDEPDDPDPDVPDPEYVDSPVAHAYLYRVYNGHRTFMQEVTEGDQIVDKYAPLNSDYTYELLEIATTGEISIVEEDNFIDSDYWYVYYGQDNEKIARALWNPSGDVSLSRPEKQQIRYSGRKYPVTYDSDAREETYSFSTVITDRSELENFREMMNDNAQGVWKSADGSVYAADFEFSYSADYTDYEVSWNAKLEVTRIESEAL